MDAMDAKTHHQESGAECTRQAFAIFPRRATRGFELWSTSVLAVVKAIVWRTIKSVHFLTNSMFKNDHFFLYNLLTNTIHYLINMTIVSNMFFTILYSGNTHN
jgi:hypothetical protein